MAKVTLSQKLGTGLKRSPVHPESLRKFLRVIGHVPPSYSPWKSETAKLKAVMYAKSE